MDDWLAELEEQLKSIGDCEKSEKLSQWFKEIFQDSDANLSISEAMSAALESRYGVRFFVLRHSVDMDEWIHVEKNYECRGDKEFRIIYAGNILPQKELQSLTDIIEAVSRLHGQGMRVRIELYGAKFLTGKYARRLISSPAVEYKGFVSRAEFPRLLADADLLIVPVNFDSESLRFIRYSFPAKVPEYMASGTPIVVYGPKGTPPVDYARAAGWGYVVTERDSALLEAGILELMRSSELRTQLGQKARQLAFRDHNAAMMRQKFWELMCDVAFGELHAGIE
ncbi:MAG: glycosyltransferase, partial [Acidobacteriota bacterium]